MTDVIVTDFGDTWVNSLSGRRGENYGKDDLVRLKSGERIGLVVPRMASIVGRVVIDANLRMHAGEGGVAAQDITIGRAAEKFQPGRVTFADDLHATTGATVTVAVPATAEGGEIVLAGLGPMMQFVADGTPFHGFVMTTSSASSQPFYASDSGKPAFELHLTLSDITDAPSNLRPDGAAVGTATPVLAWYADDQVARRVQVDTPAALADPDDVAPDFDTGMEASTDLEFALAGEHTPAGAGPHYWRVQVEAEGDETEPQWSDLGLVDRL